MYSGCRRSASILQDGKLKKEWAVSGFLLFWAESCLLSVCVGISILVLPPIDIDAHAENSMSSQTRIISVKLRNFSAPRHRSLTCWYVHMCICSEWKTSCCVLQLFHCPVEKSPVFCYIQYIEMSFPKSMPSEHQTCCLVIFWVVFRVYNTVKWLFKVVKKDY